MPRAPTTLLSSLLLLGCAPAHVAPIAAPPPPASAAVPAPVAPPLAPSQPARPSRRGECGLDDALADFLGEGEPAWRCGDLPSSATPGDYERTRACILDAVSGRKAFSATFTLRGKDSVLMRSLAGRATGAGYEVRAFSYDGCPSGCGTGDPEWASQTCHPLLDLRSACSLVRKRVDADEGLRWACEEVAENPSGDPSDGAGLTLGLWCNAGVDAGACPSASGQVKR